MLQEKSKQISDHPYRILIIGGCRSGRINVLLDLISDQWDIYNFFCMLKINC